MLFSYPLMAAIQEISGRIGRTTGRGVAGNIRRHYPAWLLNVIAWPMISAEAEIWVAESRFRFSERWVANSNSKFILLELRDERDRRD